MIHLDEECRVANPCDGRGIRFGSVSERYAVVLDPGRRTGAPSKESAHSTKEEGETNAETTVRGIATGVRESAFDVARRRSEAIPVESFDLGRRDECRKDHAEAGNHADRSFRERHRVPHLCRRTPIWFPISRIQRG